MERIAFLDANYAYETERHRDKLAAWLKASDRHFLVVLAYNDAAASLNGKSFVSTAGARGRGPPNGAGPGGAVRSQERAHRPNGAIQHMGGRIKFLLKENPDRKVLHTVMVEHNGFIESILAGTHLEGTGFVYFGDRAYSQYIEAPH